MQIEIFYLRPHSRTTSVTYRTTKTMHLIGWFGLSIAVLHVHNAGSIFMIWARSGQLKSSHLLVGWCRSQLSWPHSHLSGHTEWDVVCESRSCGDFSFRNFGILGPALWHCFDQTGMERSRNLRPPVSKKWWEYSDKPHFVVRITARRPSMFDFCFASYSAAICLSKGDVEVK